MEKIYFEKINKRKIFCVFSSPKKDNKKIIIFSHGFRGSNIGPARSFVNFSQYLLNYGYSSLRFDQYGCGNSDGDFLNSSFSDWVNTIVYFANKYLKLKYKVALLGQSMGATASMIAVNQSSLKNKIPAVILWVPDPKSYLGKIQADKVYEEEGQIYKGKFWQEAQKGNFFNCLKNFSGKIHLVYGEFDRYVSQKDRQRVLKIIKKRGDQFLILKKQNHSPWSFPLTQKVFEKELEFLNKYLV